ncbi:hypothetical protein V8V91_15090 [Algoriphagus halophilus]|uniref:hypothetical protein n=1 Tax=Algoriphagus halophilus TaxID=226505 RepID=UPI00358EC317
MNSSFSQKAVGFLVLILGILSYIPTSIAQEVIPFPQKKSGGTPGLTIQESIYSPNKEKAI